MSKIYQKKKSTEKLQEFTYFLRQANDLIARLSSYSNACFGSIYEAFVKNQAELNSAKNGFLSRQSPKVPVDRIVRALLLEVNRRLVLSTFEVKITKSFATGLGHWTDRKNWIMESITSLIDNSQCALRLHNQILCMFEGIIQDSGLLVRRALQQTHTDCTTNPTTASVILPPQTLTPTTTKAQARNGRRPTIKHYQHILQTSRQLFGSIKSMKDAYIQSKTLFDSSSSFCEL